MKKIALICSLVLLCVAGLVYGQATGQLPWLDYLGLHIGARASDKIGFYGATPVVKQTITNTAPIQIQVVDITGATNTIAVYTSTNQVNQLRNALVNLGLASTTGN